MDTNMIINTDAEIFSTPPQIEKDIYKQVFVQELLNSHNSYRRRHGAPNLEIDARLTRQSQTCAEDILDVENLETTRYPSVGENIYILHVSDPSYCPRGEFPVHEWYKQKKLVEFGKEPSSNNSANFTQVVWKASKQLGVGVACNGNKIVIVCQYMPPGNIYGEYCKNVLPELEQSDADGNELPQIKSNENLKP